MQAQQFYKSTISMVGAAALMFSAPLYADQSKGMSSQETGKSMQQSQKQSEKKATLRADQIGEPITASILMGKNVKDAHGSKIGEVEEMVVSRTGRITHALVSFGGIMNLGEDLIPVPWELFSIDKQFAKSPDDSPLYLEVTQNRLREAPRIRKPGFPVPATEVTVLDRADAYFEDDLRQQRKEWREKFQTAK